MKIQLKFFSLAILVLTACITKKRPERITSLHGPQQSVENPIKNTAIRDQIDLIKKDARAFLTSNPMSEKDPLIISDFKKLVQITADSDYKLWREFIQSPVFSQNLASYDSLSGLNNGQSKTLQLQNGADKLEITTDSDRKIAEKWHEESADPKSPAEQRDRLSEKGIIAVISLTTMAASLNTGYSLSFKRTNGYFCAINKALLVSIGLSLASATFFTVSLGLEERGEGFDKILEVLGIGTGSLVALQAIGTFAYGSSMYIDKSRQKSLSGNNLSQYVRDSAALEKNERLPEDIQEMMDSLDVKRGSRLTPAQKARIEEYLDSKIEKMQFKTEGLAKSPENITRFKTYLENKAKLMAALKLDEADMKVLNQFLHIEYDTSLSSTADWDKFKQSANFQTLVAGTYIGQDYSDLNITARQYNSVRSKFRQYLKNKGLSTGPLYSQLFFDFVEHQAIIRQTGVPHSYLTDLKVVPESLDHINWAQYHKSTWKRWHYDYGEIAGVKKSNYSMYNGVQEGYFYVDRFADIDGLSQKMMAGSVVGLAAGIGIVLATLKSQNSRESGLLLADTSNSFHAYFRRMGRQISRLQSLARQM